MQQMALTDFSVKMNGLINTFKTGVRNDLPFYNTQSQDAEFNTQGLPKAFLHSLRTLFDILDDGRRGFVHISEIESRWSGAETRDLPAGVLESLRRVAAHHGCLTFERFVAGLRNSMLNPENSSRPLDPNQQPSKPSHKPGGSVRPLGPSNGLNTQYMRQIGRDRHQNSATYSADPLFCGGFERPECSNRSDSIRIGRKALHSSRIRVIESPESANVQNTLESVGMRHSKSETTTGFTRSRRHGRNHDEQRRHTITNGVDYGMLKQMKEFEQEKDSLLAGLEVLERAREWYQAQIHNVIEAQRHIGKSHSTEFLTGPCQSRLEVLLPKLQDVTRCLSDLMTFTSANLLSAGVSSAAPAVTAQAPPQAIHILKEQNRLLTQEVSEKSDRITQLEQEKSALIKQLFEARARNTHDSSALDSTFI